MITSIGAIFLLVVAIGFAGWFFMQYTDQKTNVDAKVSSAVMIAKKPKPTQTKKSFLNKKKNHFANLLGLKTTAG